MRARRPGRDPTRRSKAQSSRPSTRAPKRGDRRGRGGLHGRSFGGAPLKLLETRVYRGPSPYGYRPVIRLTVDLEALEESPSDLIPGFTGKLLGDLPTLQEHGCSYGEPGGFVKRLEDGTWFGHIAEHVAIELQCLAGTPVTYGKTRSTGQHGVYHVIYSFEDEQVGRRAGELALRYLRGILPEGFVDRLDPAPD